MLYIEGLENNTIRLEKSRNIVHSFTVVSRKDNGRPSPFVINFISDSNINAFIENGNALSIYVDASKILTDEHIILSNALGDSCRLLFIPNEYYTMNRKYTFKVTSKKLLDDGSLNIKVFSKVNDMEIGWKCTYCGNPMVYDITPDESEIGEHVVITPRADILSEFDSLLEFTQDESNNKIRLVLTNTPEMGITQIKKVD